MIDFTTSIELFNIYKGSEKKKTLVYNKKKYLVKFPDPIRQKNKEISYINNTFSEYLGSHIFKMVGMNTQNTILGTYQYNGTKKIVCACEDFTTSESTLYEFENLVLSTNLEKKVDTEISDIMKVIEKNSNLIDVESTKQFFWDMFIIDFLIGNTDRHNGNWGFLMNRSSKVISLAPIYDCGSSLSPLLEELELQKLEESELRNIALNTYSVLKQDSKKINYIQYIKEPNHMDCRLALFRCFPKIDIKEITRFIDQIEQITPTRKQFYKQILCLRYEILKEIFETKKGF